MGDTKWGFKANYGHRHLPFAWHSSSGFNYYDHEALNKKSFRPDKMPVSREEFLPVTTQYVERAQDARWSMSNYGCHRELEWDQSLRMPRNPFPGKPNREMDYLQEQSPCCSPATSCITTRAGTPRSKPRTTLGIYQELSARDRIRSLSPRCSSMTPRGYGRMRPFQGVKVDAMMSERPSFAKWE
eukprot:TRINITY_DN26419_c0_g1_i2.p1 TRINITY_DN26419_c0_g1~~TRINITY_DN26419_c0_g1_i2.p1  ORF type:complete len:185 (+),score=24.90 TRINITY_DN26419_c0_g1_i2:71-625(+)